MKTTLILAAAGFAAMQLSAADVDWSKLPPASTQTGVTFDKDIAPIFKASCVRCHGSERPARAGLKLDSLEGVMKGATDRDGNVTAVVTSGDSANSLIVKAISQLDPKTAMPPKPRGPRGPRPMGTNAPAGPGGGNDAGAPPPPPGGGDQNAGGPPPGGPGTPPPPGGDNGAPPPPRPMGPKPLTADQVGLVRAWIDQGAK